MKLRKFRERLQGVCLILCLLASLTLTAQSTLDNAGISIAPRDNVSSGILQLLAKTRIDVEVPAQIRRTGDPDGQANPLTVSMSSGSASALVDKTKIDGSPADTLNIAYLLFPQFDLADELARADTAIDGGSETPAVRDSVSAGILHLLSRSRTAVEISGQLVKTGNTREQVDTVSILTSASTPSSEIIETHSDGTQTRSVLFLEQRTYENKRASEKLNTSYLVFPQFDLADELADPRISVDSATSTSSGLVEIRVHTQNPTSLNLPNEIDKTYVIDPSIYQIVAVKSKVSIGVSEYSHVLRYSNFKPFAGGVIAAATITEHLDHQQLWQLTVQTLK